MSLDPVVWLQDDDCKRKSPGTMAGTFSNAFPSTRFACSGTLIRLVSLSNHAQDDPARGISLALDVGLSLSLKSKFWALPLNVGLSLSLKSKFLALPLNVGLSLSLKSKFWANYPRTFFSKSPRQSTRACTPSTGIAL
ncbi:hypothetical protein [Fibrobacter sp.]|uniref:hypothetical protein n=1 Tax=Fibrobacter sp. TaxID=35828 RepID=UPI0025BC41F0|nr:hypothetical protein [Fibrobacter sp.]MBR3073659.1 hypothetical protein [Fibrobacter sp.]